MRVVPNGGRMATAFSASAPARHRYGPALFMSFDPASVDTSALKARVAEMRRFL
jgi:hypothetical protein